MKRIRRSFTTSKRSRVVLLLAGLGLLVAAAVTAYFALWQPAQPTTGRLYIVEPRQTATRGGLVEIAIRIDSSVPIDTVMAKLRYDPATLRYKEVKYDTSQFGSSIPATHQSDMVLLQVAKLGGNTVQGDVPVATVVFTALADGTTTVTLTDGNAAKAGQATNPKLEPKGKKL